MLEIGQSMPIVVIPQTNLARSLMTRTKRTHRRASSSAPQSDSSVSQTRVDAAHCVEDVKPESQEPPRQERNENLLAALDQGNVHAVEQIRLQAGQLAGHLRTQQSDVDRREAQLNARIAQLENELRTSQLWFQQAQHECSGREGDLQTRVKELEERATSLSAAEVSADQQWHDRESALQKRESLLAERDHQLATAQRQLEKQQAALRHAENKFREDRRKALDEQRLGEQQWAVQRNEQREQLRLLAANHEKFRAALDKREKKLGQSESRQRPPRDDDWRRQSEQATRELEETARKLAARKKQLDDAEAIYREKSRLLEKAREEFQNERVQSATSLRKERLQWQERQQVAENDVKLELARLQQRNEKLDQQATAVQAIRDQVLELHRESLEMRLAMEELWGQVSGRISSAEVTQLLSSLRRRLSDNYKLVRSSLAEERQVMEKLVLRLDEKQQQLVAQREQLLGWQKRREEEIEEQAARLVAREQELDREHHKLQRLMRQWNERQSNVKSVA